MWTKTCSFQKLTILVFPLSLHSENLHKVYYSTNFPSSWNRNYAHFFLLCWLFTFGISSRQWFWSNKLPKRTGTQILVFWPSHEVSTTLILKFSRSIYKYQMVFNLHAQIDLCKFDEFESIDERLPKRFLNKNQSHDKKSFFRIVNIYKFW